jgi:PTS system cellobiose-specific IIB component
MPENRPIRALLVCAGGLSTSLLKSRILDAAESAGIQLELTVDYLDDLGQHDFESDPYDIILLAPQVGFMRRHLAGKFERFGIPVERLDPMSFGMMDGEQLLRQIQQALAIPPTH